MLDADRRLQRFDPFDFSAQVLDDLKGKGLRLGVISNTGDEPGSRLNQLLGQAGLFPFLDPALLLYSKDLGKERIKDSPEVFDYAAQLAGLEKTPERCLFVGEDARERGHALDAKWRVCPHPLLVSEVLAGEELRYVRIGVPPKKASEPWRRTLKQLPLVPLHVDGPGGLVVYALTSQGVAARLMNAQFRVSLLGDAGTPLRTELYLLRDDKAKESGFLDTEGEVPKLFARADSARMVLESGAGQVLVALPPEVGLDSIHFENARHGHTLRLMPDPHLLDAAVAPASFAPVAHAPGAVEGPLLSEEETTAWSLLTAESLQDRVERFSGTKPLQAGSADVIRSRHVLHPDNQRAVSALARELRDLAPDRLRVSLHQFSHLDRTLHSVVAELPGQSAELVLVTAHLDSIAMPGDSSRDPAPGADDDMSGCAGVLAIAERFLALTSADLPPARTVQFALFNDEENGLVGSKAYARQLRSAGAQIAGVFQMDMIGFDKVPPSTWEVHVGFSPSPETEARSRPLADLLFACQEAVSPELPEPKIFAIGEINPDPAEQRSDHASFQQHGYPGCCVSESFFTGEGTPHYHQQGDRSDTINWAYAAHLARAVGAAAWTLAKGAPALAGAAAFGRQRSALRSTMKREIDIRKEGRALLGKQLPVTRRAFVAAAPGNLAPGVGASLITKALTFIQSESSTAGFAPDAPAEFAPDPTIQRASSGAAAVHLHQQYHGVPVFGMARTVRFSAQSEVIDAKGESAPLTAGLKTEPELSAKDAIRLAAMHLASTGGEMEKDKFGQESPVPKLQADGYAPEIVTSFNLPSRPTVLTAGPFEKPVPAHLVIFPSPAGSRLAWHIVATFADYADQYVIIVAADTPEGEILYCISTLHKMRARGNVFELSPGLKARAAVPFPRPITDYPVMPASPLAGFPADWVSDRSTIGNSTRATLGLGTQPLTGITSDGVAVFDPQSDSGDDQKLLNIFYFCNYAHDFLFILGFDEAAGNFQQTNFTNTGLGNDPVRARAHSGPVNGTANMLTFPDGTSPVMNMGLVAGGINRHTAFDADVVLHEYAHGLTNRLVGGRLNTNALDEPQSSGMGEGWSDYYALTIVSFATGQDKVVSGDWVINQPGGIRTAPYDDSYPTKFGGIGDFTDEHDVGEVWCAALMMMTRRVRQALGNDLDGYRICWQIVTDGLKLTPANPSFLDGRDAILLALDALKSAGRLSPATHRLVRRACWVAFAHFEMGVNAASDGPSLNGVVPDTTLPADL